MMQKYAIEIHICLYKYHINGDTLLSLTRIVEDRYHLNRGDVIHYGNNKHGHPEYYFWDGEKVIKRIDDHPDDLIPLAFSCPEFSPTYFRNVIDHNTICNIDLSLREQIKSNMMYGAFTKEPNRYYYNRGDRKPHPKPYPLYIAYSWFNQDIKWLDSDRYDEIKTAIEVIHVPDVLADLIMQFMGKTCWVHGDTHVSYRYSHITCDMLRCQCKRIVTGDSIPLIIDPPIDTCGNVGYYTHCLNPETHVAALKKDFLSANYFQFSAYNFVDYDIISAN